MRSQLSRSGGSRNPISYLYLISFPWRQSVFQYILGIDSMESGMTLVNIILEIIDQIVILFFSESPYSVEDTTSFRLMPLFAFATRLMKLLSVAFTTLQQIRYKRFVQMIGRTIRCTPRKKYKLNFYLLIFLEKPFILCPTIGSRIAIGARTFSARRKTSCLGNRRASWSHVSHSNVFEPNSTLFLFAPWSGFSQHTGKFQK